MGRSRVRPSTGVDWHLPDGNGGFVSRPFATTTSASSHLIEILAAEGFTWAQIVDEILFDEDAIAVAQRFVDEGHGDTKAALMVR